MFIGGPVKRDSALCLATLRVGMQAEGVPGLRHVQGRVVMVDLDADPDTPGPGHRGRRGYSPDTPAGPSASSDGEIERDDWIVLSALPSDVLIEPRIDLWGRVLRRQPLPMSLLATHPIDVEPQLARYVRAGYLHDNVQLAQEPAQPAPELAAAGLRRRHGLGALPAAGGHGGDGPDDAHHDDHQAGVGRGGQGGGATGGEHHRGGQLGRGHGPQRPSAPDHRCEAWSTTTARTRRR